MNNVQFVHAAKICSQLETALPAAAERLRRALVEANTELQRMLDILNEGRTARGLPALDVHLTEIGVRQ